MKEVRREQLYRGAIALLGTWAVMLSMGWSARNPLTLVVFAGMMVVVRGGERPLRPFGAPPLKRGGEEIGRVVAALYTAAVVLATYDTATGRFESGVFKAAALFIVCVGWFLVFYYGVGMGVEAVGSRPSTRSGSSGDPSTSLLRQSSAQAGSVDGAGSGWAKAIPFAVCFLCYLPWYLYSYPGIFSPDPVNQAEQALHVIPYGNHHPLIHTLMIELCYKIGYAVTGSVNGGFGFYTFVQMTLLALAAAVTVNTIREKITANQYIRAAATAFYALVPFNAVAAVTVSKDTMFAVITMFFVCNLVYFVTDGIHDKKRIAFFIVTGILFCLFRSNGFFAFLIFAPCFVILFKNERKKALILSAIVIIVSAVIRGPVMDAVGVIKPDLAESLHVPEQQIARVIVNGRSLTEEETEMISAVIDMSYVKELYAPGFADNIKELVRAGHPEALEADKAGYLKLWLTLGMKYPKDYIAAWADLTRGYYYPDGDYEVATLEGVYENDLGICHAPLLPVSKLYRVRALILRLGTFTPLYGLLFSMGMYAWIYLLSVTVILCQGAFKRRLVIPVIGLAVLMTLFLATPVSDEFRYAYSYIACAPLLLIAGMKSDTIKT